MIHSQIRSGSAFLKMLPGARTQGMAGSLTGSLDEMNAIYANPGAVGFLREWQWSTSYTEWIADVYNLSFMYGKRISTPWSSQSRLALGIQYQGVREFNSTNQPGVSASANDLLVNLSIGNPLTLISRNLSLGTNIKYFRSTLAGLNASTFMTDLGLLYRFKRFKIENGLFDYGHVSAGVSLSHLGRPLKFISDGTPLPRTFRAGAALNLGSHQGLQVQIATDYRKVRDEKAGLGFGTEVSWGYRVALRSGYNFNDNFLSKFSFGLSFRLDDQTSPVKNVLPGINNAMRLDVAGVEKNEFFSTSFLGAVNVYPIGPEKFEFIDPYQEHQTRSKSITLSWQLSRDPDLYDDVNYILLIAQSHDSTDGSE
ncbi:PorV/PorQ family protein, partial [bacterium]|nr:PorV/PorQ family protein [bacterium]